MRKKPSLVLSAAGFLVMLACGDSTGPANQDNPQTPNVPPTEEVNFDAIGNALVLFSRGDAKDYLIDGAKRTMTGLPGPSTSTWAPRLSPDGTRVTGLQWANQIEAYDVYVWDVTGGNLRRISYFDGNVESTPAWTTDGTGVVFMVTPLDITAERGIYRWDAAAPGRSGFLRQFVPDSTGYYRCPNLELHSSANEGDGTAAVSAQGGVAYTCNGALVVATSADDSLAIRYDEPGERVAGVAWSPDGLDAAFIGLTSDATNSLVSTRVRVLHVEDGTVRSITSRSASGASSPGATYNPHDLCWLGDGSRIVFSAQNNDAGHTEEASSSLYVVNADGSGLTALTSAPGVFDHNVSCAGGY